MRRRVFSHRRRESKAELSFLLLWWWVVGRLWSRKQTKRQVLAESYASLLSYEMMRDELAVNKYVPVWRVCLLAELLGGAQ